MWRVTSDVLARSERRGLRWTLFVHSLGARLAGVDIGPRLRELAERGHEIAQHTHYYAPATNGAGHKRTLLSPDNVRRALEEDYEYLEGAGCRPRGYVSGAWVVQDSLFSWLGTRGFSYDCSYRSYALVYEHPDALAGDDCPKPFRRDGVLVVPTTAGLADGLRQQVRPTPRGLPVETLSYELTYLHDYDLARAKVRLGLDALLALSARRRSVNVTAAALAGEIAGHVAEP